MLGWCFAYWRKGGSLTAFVKRVREEKFVIQFNSILKNFIYPRGGDARHIEQLYISTRARIK